MAIITFSRYPVKSNYLLLKIIATF